MDSAENTDEHLLQRNVEHVNTNQSSKGQHEADGGLWK